MHCVMHCTENKDGGYANGLWQRTGQENSPEAGSQGSVMGGSGIPLERVGLYSVCQGSKNQMDCKAKINSINIKSD